MAKYIINGKAKLDGQITIAGAKNNALKVLPATLLTTEECIIHNIPDIEDIRIMLELMTSLGSKITKIKKGSYRVKNDDIKLHTLDDELGRKLRSSIMFLAPLLTRFGEINLPHPGGCVIGRRPINFFIDSFEILGAKIKFTPEGYIFKANRLKGAKIVFPQISHTGTESVIMAAVLAEGNTQIVNAACEPEVIALAEMLNAMGARISGAGTSKIIIHGVKKLSGTEFRVIPDRLETGSFIILAAVNKQKLTINNCNPEHLEVPLEMLRKVGVEMEISRNKIIVNKSGNYNALKLVTHEYPGFPTDLQAPMTVLLTQAKGLSMVHETIYESRLFYTDMLNRMGANIILCDPHRVIVQGPAKLYGKKVESPDLRAGIAMVIAASIAEGETIIDNIYQIERGYENIIKRLQSIGMKITKTD